MSKLRPAIYTPEIVAKLRETAMLDNAEPINPAAVAGHNAPPEPTPFEQSRDEIEALFGEAKNWADGTPIENQAHADAIADLMAQIRDAGKRADARRVSEKKPFDDAAAEVQARYNPLVQKDKGRVDLAIATLKKVLEPYRLKKEAEARAEADRARAEAEAARLAAQEAFRASDVTDLAAREEAERLLAAAKDAEKYEKRAEKQTGAIKGIRLVTIKTVRIDNMTEFARYVWTSHKADVDEFFTEYASRLVKAGIPKIPGVTIIETKEAR